MYVKFHCMMTVIGFVNTASRFQTKGARSLRRFCAGGARKPGEASYNDDCRLGATWLRLGSTPPRLHQPNSAVGTPPAFRVRTRRLQWPVNSLCEGYTATKRGVKQGRHESHLVSMDCALTAWVSLTSATPTSAADQRRAM